MRPAVTIADTSNGVSAALEAIFAPYGGIANVIPSGSRVYVKPNGVHFSAGTYTEPAVVERPAGLAG